MATKSDPVVDKDVETTYSPRHQLILLDDDDHSYEYVIEMLGQVFGYDSGKGLRIAEEVDRTGRSIVFVGHLEVVEFKQQKVHRYGADPRIPSCRGSMSAVIESLPA